MQNGLHNVCEFIGKKSFILSPPASQRIQKKIFPSVCILYKCAYASKSILSPKSNTYQCLIFLCSPLIPYSRLYVACSIHLWFSFCTSLPHSCRFSFSGIFSHINGTEFSRLQQKEEEKTRENRTFC